MRNNSEIIILREDTEYLTGPIQRLGSHMYGKRAHSPKPAIRLPKSVTIHLETHIDDETTKIPFVVTAVSAGRDEVPMVHGFWGGDNKAGMAECMDLICRRTLQDGVLEDRFWVIDELIRAIFGDGAETTTSTTLS